ncbi:MAG: tRNA (5-methylaminomethyl-2-thiouridine)(34)-methyltransferase MnmD [Paracoccaceae bacterium]
MPDQTADIQWRDGATPVSTRFDDPYFSLNDGLAETGHVFLAGNGLPARFRPGFHIAELGFGTGLNMLCAWDLWNRSEQTGPLYFTSFEQYPMALTDMETALHGFPELAYLTVVFLKHWPNGSGCLDLPSLKLRVITGDARQTLPHWNDIADAWFLDGFSPAKNPQLWGEKLLADVARHTTGDGTFATYTAAGHVRRALGDAGFDVNRCPGYGRKRHMTVGKKAPKT